MSGGRAVGDVVETESVKREVGAWDLSVASWRDCTSNPLGLEAAFSGTFRRSLCTTFSGHPSKPNLLQAISLTL